MGQSLDPGTEAADRDHVEALVRASGTSFYWAMRLLPAAQREGMYAIYAFCRVVDDIADDPGLPEDKRAELAAWREKIDALYAGQPYGPVCRAMLHAVRRFGLAREDFLAVIDGMEMDAASRVRIADEATLDLYCDRVACAVGRLSVRVFGVPEPIAGHLAHAQGQALQLTNILRDVSEDATRDRLYLPESLLRSRGILDTDDLTQVLRHGGVADVCAELGARAQACFDEAASLAARCDRHQVRPALIMMEVYRRTLARLVARGWQRWAEPVALSSAEKLWVALRYGVV